MQHHQLPVQIDADGLVLVEADVPVARHLPERVDDVAGLDRADRHGGQERVELEEVLLVDEERVPVLARGARAADRPGHVEPREAAAEDEETLAGHEKSLARARGVVREGGIG